MASYNRVIVMGNLTRDPEVRQLPSGMTVAEIGLAVNDRYKNAKGEMVDEATFVDVTLWGRTAEIAGEYLSKGSPALIEGRLKLDTWESDGQKRSKLKVVADKLQLLGSKGDGGIGGGEAPRQQQAPSRRPAQSGSQRQFRQQPVAAASSGDEDIPF